MAHTPAPWRYEPQGYSVMHEHGKVATVIRHQDGPLVAAAPVLLKALEEALAWARNPDRDEGEQPNIALWVGAIRLAQGS